MEARIRTIADVSITLAGSDRRYKRAWPAKEDWKAMRTDALRGPVGA